MWNNRISMSNKKFKIGDNVRCLSNGYTYAKRNGIYTVSEVHYDERRETKFIKLKEVKKTCSYECNDFELCKKQIIEFL